MRGNLDKENVHPSTKNYIRKSKKNTCQTNSWLVLDMRVLHFYVIINCTIIHILHLKLHMVQLSTDLSFHSKYSHLLVG